MAVASCAAAAPAPTQRFGSGNRNPAELFARADLNGDGHITRIEFVDSRGRAFDRLDRNGDGYLDRNDAGRRRRAKGGPAAAEMQRAFDLNSDGRLSRLEFTDGPMTVFDRMDRDGDGSIDTDELSRMARDPS
ncbi:EF-hand domain-containing protein [Brevundimonas diminuta]|nr:EF-hand domain-containing protein [Brevundimonas diminuta]